MKKFFAIYMAPASTIEEWMKTPEAERKVAEEKMQVEWREWMKTHAGAVTETAGLGKTKKVTTEGISDIKNNLMLYSIVQADSAEAAAKLLDNHPHLGIPGASIEIMEATALPGMQ